MNKASNNPEADDGALEPNTFIKNELNKIIHYPSSQNLLMSERKLLYKYRVHLSSQKKGIIHFYRSIDWSMSEEAQQAYKILNEWTQVDLHVALELMGPSFANPILRSIAIKRLKEASEQELLLNLLQLVQALKYEPKDIWDQKPINLSGKEFDCRNTSREDSICSAQVCEDNYSLCSFLISKASKSLIFANYFYWYLFIECENDDTDQMSNDQEIFLSVMDSFQSFMQQDIHSHIWHMIQLQQDFIRKLVSLVAKLNQEPSIPRQESINKLKKLLSAPELNLCNFEALPLPLDPEVNICGLYPEEATLFKSLLKPCKLVLKTSEGSVYPLIWKTGFDLRQDQLIIQIITVINEILLNENLDLKLTPYKVLPTSRKHGFVQFVDSHPIMETAVPLDNRNINQATHNLVCKGCGATGVNFHF